ncbi:MerR-type HTH domain containing protein [uncultured Caudovirales phage]|uniref:MerR-type HTH domain containing protein n=1 Tax=uncultured Caudovirales phage TaxID=2100421 RepID=A0A6J5RIE9_9CAUD|nr:MerR-type HTH domain containing protein [uncultured Caudovirales phage]
MKKYLTLVQAAARAGVHPETLRGWAMRHVVPSHRIHPTGRWYFNPADIDKMAFCEQPDSGSEQGEART